jgi:hypothetical protein
MMHWHPMPCVKSRCFCFCFALHNTYGHSTILVHSVHGKKMINPLSWPRITGLLLLPFDALKVARPVSDRILELKVLVQFLIEMN